MPGIYHHTCCCDPCGACHDNPPTSWTATWADTEFDTACHPGVGSCSGVGGSPKTELTTPPSLGTYDVPYVGMSGTSHQWNLDIGGQLDTWCTTTTCGSGNNVCRQQFRILITMTDDCEIAVTITHSLTPIFTFGLACVGALLFNEATTPAAPCGEGPHVLTNELTAFDSFFNRGRNGTVTLTPNFD